MPLFPDLTILFALIAIAIIYLLFKILSKTSSYKEKKKDILEKYQQQRTRSLKLQDFYGNYILAHNTQKDIFYNAITYGDFLKALQKNHITNLSDKNYVKLKNTDNRIVLKKTADMLEEQETILSDAEGKAKYLS